MVQLIVGRKGKGKTKQLLDKVNAEVKNASGNIVYLDKNTEHMYELNNKIRLIDVSRYMIDSTDSFIGFICGIISQDHDLQQMYFDAFLQLARSDESNIAAVVAKLEKLGETFGVDFVLSVSLDADELPAEIKDKVLVSL